MTKDYIISIYLDVRRKKANGKYPVKLRVFIPSIRRQKLYPTAFEFVESEFKSIWETVKPRSEHKEAQMKLKALELHANELADKLPYFTLEKFELALYNKSHSNRGDVVNLYHDAIDQYKKNNQIGTASSYELSLASLLEFQKRDTLHFTEISSQWLKDYERHMVDVKKRSSTTVGIYLRPLRAIFNTAIENGIISPDLYPFGRRKYTIPAPTSTKKALTKEQLKLLFETMPTTPEQTKAKAFWFFSYACNGMNFKDIANLRYQDIIGDTIQFRRAKTVKTNTSQAPVVVYLNDYTRKVIDDYGNTNKSPKNYIFSLVDHTSSSEAMHTQLKNFIRFINQHFSKFAKEHGVEEQVSTYWARHSFATNAIRSGASMEFVSEALSHSNLNTTKKYFAGFEDEKKKEISNKLMTF